MARPRMYDEALRERLVDEASKMLSENGYHNVSLRVLTRNAGTSTNAVYTLFGSKEALMAEVVVRALDAMFDEDFNPNVSEDARADLLRLARKYREQSVADPQVFTGTFEVAEEAMRPGSLTDRINPEVKSIAHRLSAPLLAFTTRVAQENPERHLDAQAMATSLLAVIHGFIRLENAGALLVTEEEMGKAFDNSVHSLYLGWTGSDPHALNQVFDAEGKPSLEE